jgi:hypothetical protein
MNRSTPSWRRAARRIDLGFGGALENELPHRALSAPDAPSSPGEIALFRSTSAHSYSLQSAKTSDLRNVEQWVQNEIRRLGLKTGETTRMVAMPTDLKLEGYLLIDDQPIHVDDLMVYVTPGGGTCLIHSFLTSLSPSYRTLSSEDKVRVGEWYRRLLGEEQVHSLIRCQGSEGCYYPGLTIGIGELIAQFLDVNVIFISSSGIDVNPSDLRAERVDVMILYHNGHFDAIELPFPEPSDEQHRRRVRSEFHESLQFIQPVDGRWLEDEQHLLERPSIAEMRKMLTQLGMVTESDPDLVVENIYFMVFMNGGQTRRYPRRSPRLSPRRSPRRHSPKRRSADTGHATTRSRIGRLVVSSATTPRRSR